MKYCKLGDHNLDESAFGKHKGRKDGLQDHCKECRKATRTDKARPGYMQEYYLKNKEKIAIQNKEYYEANKNDLGFKEKRSDYQQKWSLENKDKRAGYWQKYYLANSEKLIAKKYFYEKARKKRDIGFRLMLSCRRRLLRALKGERKMYSFMESVGCTREELKTHLESQFQPGMSWDNYGYKGWHIDHILPLSKFDLTNQEQFKVAVHFTNLQPLWQKENMKKSNKVSQALSL